jgi:hypothetical protein
MLNRSELLLIAFSVGDQMSSRAEQYRSRGIEAQQRAAQATDNKIAPPLQRAKTWLAARREPMFSQVRVNAINAPLRGGDPHVSNPAYRPAPDDWQPGDLLTGCARAV